LGLFVLRGQGEVVYLNPYAERFFKRLANLDRGQLLGRPLWSACPEVADSPFVREYARAAAEHRDFQLEVYYPALGRWFTIEANLAGDYKPFFLQDVTRRVFLERAAQPQAEELTDAAGEGDAFLIRFASEVQSALARRGRPLGDEPAERGPSRTGRQSG
jgi:hypothetical protein